MEMSRQIKDVDSKESISWQIPQLIVFDIEQTESGALVDDESDGGLFS